MLKRLSILSLLFLPLASVAQGQPFDTTRVVIPAETPALRSKLNAYMEAAAGMLDPRPRSVLKQIPDRERRLLAIQQYIRRRDSVEVRWAWTSSEIRAFKKREEYREMLVEIERVKKAFDSLNPGYTLRPGIEVRSLGEQIANWNRVRSVAGAAREFLDSCRLELADSTYPSLPDSVALARFIPFLADYETDRPPTVAVPGFSLHGRLRAFDFRIARGREIIAGASSAMIEPVWDGLGWTDRLKEAVSAASGNLIGPLREPHEPWHYEYRR
jgi:hypothetical protein